MTNIANTLKQQIVGLAHVGFIVTDLTASIADYKKVYGVEDSDILVFPPFSQTGDEVLTRFAFIKINDSEIELIEPISTDFKHLLHSAPAGGGGINHIAWLVTDIEESVDVLAKQGIIPGYVTPNGVMDTGSKKMVYLDPETTGNLYIELIQIK
ncbi:VOC family protein [Thalassotalea psychrophila]|uniref:VOC family protein n=1 Tax=Thalassotalea psychrophila TaxID=3065647 RepID=A0ABY9TV04_9GAMM|nr:VOC family protein [Colwelliaceae bacterium SQ149]